MGERWRLANQYAVPGTGVRHTGHWLRSPRNASIKRSLLSVMDTLRGVSVPPNSYDDIARSSIYDRNWKRFRRTRWRPV